ncbi:MAG: hypothetical protein GX447_00925 [Elusimicrobia bacterium]|nr:hypothetical protein [Elusimicrobiota bacterium]
MKKIIILALFSANLFAQKEDLPKDLREISKKGIDAIYAVELDKAEQNFKEAVEKYPDHPFGHFGLAMTKWAHFEYLDDESDPSLDSQYYQLTDKAIEIGKAWIKKHPKDANAHMCMGGMYGLRARLYLMQHSWIKAYFSGRKALSYMKKSLEIDPELYDSYLGLGMYEYSAGTLTGVVKVLSKLVMPGDAKKGIEYLKICKEKGYFNSEAAELILIEIFTQHASAYADAKTAVEWSKELRKKYPYHAQMHFVEIVSLYEAKMYEEAEKEMKEYLSRVGKHPHYREKYLSRIYVALGTVRMIDKDYEGAKNYFQKARETIQKEKHPSRWGVWGIVRLGNIYDIQSLRKEALDFYKEALSYKDNWGFKEYIENFKESPFNISVLPDQLPPP